MHPWFFARIVTSAIGRWHAWRNDPRAEQFVELPLHAPGAPAPAVAPRAIEAAFPDPGQPAVAERPIVETAHDHP